MASDGAQQADRARGRFPSGQAQQEAAPTRVELGRLALGLDVVQEGLHGIARGAPEVALVGHVGLHHGQRAR